MAQVCLVGGVRPAQRVASFNSVEGQTSTPVPGGQLPIVQLVVGGQPLSLGVIARINAEDDADPAGGEGLADELRWVPLAAIEHGVALARHAPIPLTQRVDPHVFPLIDVVLQVVDAGLAALAE